MKKVISAMFVVLCLIGQTVAQDSMYVHLKTGVAKFLLADIDSVKFERNATVLPEPPTEISRAYVLPSVSYSALFKGNPVMNENTTDFNVSWTQMNELYASLGITHNEFQNVYNRPTSAAVTLNDVPLAGASLAQYPLLQSSAGPFVDSYALKYQLTPLNRFGKTTIQYVFTPSSSSYPIIKLFFTFTVTAPVLEKAIIPAYQYSGHTTPADKTIYTRGLNSGSGWDMKIQLGEAFGFGSSTLKSGFGTALFNKIDGAIHEFVITDNYVKSALPSYLVSPSPSASNDLAILLGTSISNGTTMSVSPANPLDVVHRVYPVNFKTTYINGEVDNFNYFVILKNPLTIDLAPNADFTLLDKKTGAKDQFDVSKNYVVKMLGEVVVDRGVVQPKAAQFGLNNATLIYTAQNIVSAYYLVAFDFKSPFASWENAGTRLISTQKVADIKVVYNTVFATVSRIDEVKVEPDGD